MLRNRTIFWILAAFGIGTVAAFGGFAMANTFKSKPDFVKRLWDALTRVSTLGTVQKTILIAQAVHESGWGVANASRNGFNYWNLTAGSKWKGPVIHGKDTEFAKNAPVTAKPKEIPQAFRKYASDEEGVIDMLKFIGPASMYREAWAALQRGDAMDYAAKLYAKGFFTQPLPLYQKGLADGLKTVVQLLG